MTDAEAPFRILPKLDEQNTAFWTGGEHGELRFWRCQDCRWWLHPAGPRCPSCLSKSLAVEAASGRATVHTFTINHQAFMPGPELPFVIAIVELPEQPGLRLTTNIVGVPPEEVRIGMDVEVTFEHHDDVWIPLFRPAGSVAP
jgi:uncharacterized OB-fold protein